MVIFTSSDLAPNGNLIRVIFSRDTHCGKFIHGKKGIAIFPSLAGMSLTKLSLAGNNLIIPGEARESLVNYILAEDEKIANLFLHRSYCIFPEISPSVNKFKDTGYIFCCEK